MLRNWLKTLFSAGDPPRQLLIHAHMFKNAGSTLDWSLQRCFGESFVDHRDDESMKNGAPYLGPWLSENLDCEALSSHWITPPLPRLGGVAINTCLLLRDPVERMRSVYQFERQQQDVDTPGSIRAKQMTFAEYMAWQMEPMPGPVVKNYQTRYCSGQYLGEDLPAMYERAVQWLDSSRTLGLVHRYDESMVLFEFQLKPHFPQLDLSYRKQNVLSDESASFEARRASVLEDLEDIAETVLAANDFDLRLFAHAQSRFDALLAEVPDLQQRLDEFQQRNHLLQVQA